MQDTIFEIVSAAVTELNEELAYDSLENPNTETTLHGGEDGIDSLSLVSLIVDIENRVAAQLGKDVVLADEKAMSERNSPYRSVGALCEFIAGRLKETDD